MLYRFYNKSYPWRLHLAEDSVVTAGFSEEELRLLKGIRTLMRLVKDFGGARVQLWLAQLASEQGRR